jgi:TRAP transporter TAXI family solute receptor
VTRSDLKDDEVYAMTKAMYDRLPELASAHSAGKEISLQNALQGMPIPLHPGAERFFKEKGVAK